MRLIATIVSGLASVAIIGLAALMWLIYEASSDGPLPAETVIMIERGMGSSAIGQILHEKNVIESPALFKLGVVLTGAGSKLQAGEYSFPARISLLGAIRMLGSGKVVERRLTFSEGMTSHRIVELLNAHNGLSGKIDEIPPEGSLLPETYHFTHGDDRAKVIARMKQAQTDLLADLWKKRASGLPLKTPQDAVVLASIVEKETGVGEERPRIAGVFMNRLEKGMKLQSDPTVIYAITEGKKKLGRSLRRDDMRNPSPYNTYVHKGLPPGPIANPGRAALEAVLQPEEHPYLFFVADGKGGHRFSISYEQHKKNIEMWLNGR